MIRNIEISEIKDFVNMAGKENLCFNNKTQYCACFLNEKIVGFCGWMLFKTKAILKNDYVLPAYRKQGIYKKLHVLVSTGYTKVENIINKPVTIWTGVRWATNVVFKRTKRNASIIKISLSNDKYICCDEKHPFLIEHAYTSDILRIPANKLEIGDTCSVIFPGSNGAILNNVTITNIEYLKEKEDVYCCNVGYEEHSFMAEGILISNCGEMTPENYFKKTFIYFIIDNWKYWTMGSPIEKTIIINRAEVK